MEMNGMMMTGMLLCGVLGLALIALIVAGTAWLIRRSPGGNNSTPAPESPEDTLRRRFAAGELDEDEYLVRSAALRD